MSCCEIATVAIISSGLLGIVPFWIGLMGIVPFWVGLMGIVPFWVEFSSPKYSTTIFSQSGEGDLLAHG